MVSFYDLWEHMEESATPLMDSGEDSKSMQIIRAGKNLRKDDERPFWDEFMELCSNSEGMAELLGVDSSKVIAWPTRIREIMDKIQGHDQESGDNPEDTSVVPTGDNGAFTADNSDPYMGEL